MTGKNQDQPAFQGLPHQERLVGTLSTYGEIGQRLHAVQYSINGHKVALAGLKEVRQQRDLSEDEAYHLEFHEGARRRLHHSNHQIERVRKKLWIGTYLERRAADEQDLLELDPVASFRPLRAE